MGQKFGLQALSKNALQLIVCKLTSSSVQCMWAMGGHAHLLCWLNGVIVKPMHMWMPALTCYGMFLSCEVNVSQAGDRLPKAVLDAVWVMPDHVGVSFLPWQKYVSGLLQQYSVGSDDAFDDVEQCKSHVIKQIMLEYAHIVVRDMPLLSSLQRYTQYVSPCLL
jgi:hypothetical protein